MNPNEIVPIGTRVTLPTGCGGVAFKVIGQKWSAAYGVTVMLGDAEMVASFRDSAPR